MSAKKFLIAIMTVMGFFSLFYAHDLEQKNPETIFLTEGSLKEYRLFQRDIPEKHTLVIKKKNHNRNEFYGEIDKLRQLCNGDCEIITQKQLQKSTSQAPGQEDLMALETAEHVAAMIMDNNDAAIKQVLKYTEDSSYWKNANASFAGIPYTNYLLDKYSLTIQEKLFPAMFVMGLVIAVFFIGHLKQAMIVYLPCLFMAGASLSALKVLYGQMNMVTSIIPLVIFTVTMSLSFHLYFSLVELRTLRAVFKIKWAPIFLMMFTTFIGFISLGWAEISVIRIFGVVSSVLVLLATLFCFIWYWGLEKSLCQARLLKRKFLTVDVFAYSLKKMIVLGLGVVGFFSVVLVPGRLEVITDATYYFPKHQKIRERFLDVTQTVAGMPVMEIAINLGQDFSQQDMEKLQTLEKELMAEGYTQNYKIVSNNSLVAKVNQEYSGENTVPPTLESYLLLRGQLPASLQESYPVETKYRMTFLGRPLNVKQYLHDLGLVRGRLDSHGMSYQINGIHHNLMVSQGAMINVLVASFVSSALVIFAFSAIFLRSFKDTLIFVFVSLLPVSLTFSLMYFMEFSINIATVMTFSISLGLVGDSSFHIIYAKKTRFKTFEEYSRAVLLPVVGSGLLLFVCFGIFGLNSFMPIRQFGSILASILLLGTLVDLFVLPTLIYGSNAHQLAYEAKA